MELMVVIVIVAILAAVAVPLYINYVKDAKRTEAKGAIAAVITAQQVYYQNSTVEPPTYTTDPDDLNVDLSDVQRNWSVVVTSADTDGFLVEATGQGDAAGLYVCCKYSRTTTPKWGDASGDCAAP
jgi:Tfp pilus assembly protein PilE